MSLPRLEPIEFEGELVALVSPDRVHIVSPRLLERPAGDPDLRFVAYMCLYATSKLSAGREFDSRDAEAWARAALVDLDDIAGLNGPTVA